MPRDINISSNGWQDDAGKTEAVYSIEYIDNAGNAVQRTITPTVPITPELTTYLASLPNNRARLIARAMLALALAIYELPNAAAIPLVDRLTQMVIRARIDN